MRFSRHPRRVGWLDLSRRAWLLRITLLAFASGMLATSSIACLWLRDTESLTRDSTGRPDGSVDEDASLGDAAADAPVRFCSAHSLVDVCEDFDRGMGNATISWPAASDQAELKIDMDSFSSAPASLFVSLKGNEPNVKAFLLAAPPSRATKGRAAFAFRPFSTDYVIFAAIECQATSNEWNRVTLSLAPEGTIFLAHNNSENPIEVGLVGTDRFTDIELTMELGASNVTGHVKFGDALPIPYDRPIECRPEAGQRLRLGLEGAGGKAAVRFDNVVYDVQP